MKLNNRQGYMEFVDFMFGFCFMVVGLVGISAIYCYFTLQYPQSVIKRDYLLKHPEMLIVSEYQRGGELPTIPNINIKLSAQSEK